MQTDVLSAAHALGATPDLTPGQLASTEQLQQLERLRVALSAIEQAGSKRPLYQRLGLYTGQQIHNDLRQMYFTNFRRLLLHPVQLSIEDHLQHLSTGSPGDFGEAYKQLKAYLITTSNPEKSTSEFLPGTLNAIWSAGNIPDATQQALAQTQFAFYSERLPIANPLPQQPDNAVVAHAREYLQQFNGVERIYRSMLADAGKGTPDFDFNRGYPGSAQVIVDSHVVPAAFTRSGFVGMKAALANPDKFYGAEEWVLGQASTVAASKESLRDELSGRYAKEYVNHWRDFLKSASVLRFAGVSDATNKLRLLSGNRSPLMQLFWVAALNTKIDLPDSGRAFDALQRVTSGATEDHPIGSGAQAYMMALNGLQGNLYALAAAPEGTDLTNALNSALLAAGSARSSVGQVAQGFLIDPDGHVDSQVRKLMEDPIFAAEALVRRMAQAQKVASRTQ